MTDTDNTELLRVLKTEVEAVRPNNVVKALRAVVEYLEHDERRDWESNKCEDHIYLAVRTLRHSLIVYDAVKARR